jgi:hypothetical protein
MGEKVRNAILKLANHGVFDKMSDKQYLKLVYYARVGKKLNLNNPVTYNEKMQWLKLYDRKPEYTQMVDKYLAKQYAAERIGEEYITPTLGVWDHFDEIDFDKLPNQFVLKCTHDSGGVVIVQDKEKLDREQAKTKIENSLKRNYYLRGREWPYKDVSPRVIAEEYIETPANAHGLNDYKIFTFQGEAKAFYIISDRNTPYGIKLDYYDMNGNKLPFRWAYQTSNYAFQKPKNWDKMVELAEELGKGMPCLRVDFYNIDGQIRFGEMTFYPTNGMAPFEPEEWDYKFGEWIQLPARQDSRKA